MHREPHAYADTNLSFSPPVTPSFCFLLFPLSHAVGPHHGAGAKDETKHDSVWQPLSGSALIHGNPAVSRELRETERERDGQKEKPRQGDAKEIKGESWGDGPWCS